MKGEKLESEYRQVFGRDLVEKKTEKYRTFSKKYLGPRELFCLLVYLIRWSILQCVCVCVVRIIYPKMNNICSLPIR